MILAATYLPTSIISPANVIFPGKHHPPPASVIVPASVIIPGKRHLPLQAS
jgi:hypothetical protein